MTDNDSKHVDQLLLDDLRRHEDFRAEPYPDPEAEGVWLVGYGYNLTEHGIPKYIAELLLEYWARDAYESVIRLFPPEDYRWLNAEHYRIMANMVYQMGLTRFQGFRKFIHAVKTGNLITAEAELIDSKWFRQSGRRSKELVERWEKASAQEL